MTATVSRPSPDHLEQVRARLDAAGGAVPSLAALAAEAGCSPWQLQRAFTRAMGVSPAAYARGVRAARLRAALRDGATVSQAAFGAGFQSASRAYAAAKSHLGMAPGRYAKGGAGLAIGWTLRDTRLGRLLLAATALGACFVALGDDDDALRASLAHEFPRATLHDDDARLAGWASAIAERLEDGGAIHGIPLDVRGTAWQRTVWAELLAIPAGETRTYQQLARRVCGPTAARAVARACASNPVALLVPCHRVIRGDGGMGGYRWGVARKEALLMQEGRRAGGAGG
ncbi:MAG: methylated-DNA--[protein]-cysteine S-methyltransferase [Gemmatimonadales bacterium]|nr:methylated-DNA--[protein]-cysteine S-methyltransferase [Gemmatimonadales bacterium]